MKTVCISQPRFFPGLHYIHRMLVVDVFVILDTVHFKPFHEENRTRIKTPNGVQWLTVPTSRRQHKPLILDTLIDYNQPWQARTLKTMWHLYAKAPQYKQFADEITDILSAHHERLIDLDIASWQPALRLLECRCSFLRSSALEVSSTGSKLLVDICGKVNAERYLSGPCGRDYLDAKSFTEAGIDVCFHKYTYPSYKQRFGEFAGYVTYLDMLFNVGLDPKIVREGGVIET